MSRDDSFYAVSSSFSETEDSMNLLFYRMRYMFENSEKLESFEKRFQAIQQEMDLLKTEYNKEVKSRFKV